MTLHQFRAIGFFFAHYNSNLTHISNFQRFKTGELSYIEYSSEKGKHTFYQFLKDFRVIRNIIKGGSPEVLKLTRSWIEQDKADDVDKFAVLLKNKNLTHNKVMTSLASKILLLNNPAEILPIDTQVKSSVQQDTNTYSHYLPVISTLKKRGDFKECLNYVSDFSIQIEKHFKGHISNLPKVRANRLLDIYLWSTNGNLE